MEEVEKFKVRIRGRRPLLMHSPQSMMEEDETKRGEKPDSNKEAWKALYRDLNGNICVPGYIIKASMREASKDFKVPGKGKKTFKDFVKAGILIDPEYIPLEGDNYVIDQRPVVIQRNRIIRARPRFEDWALEFTVEVVDPIIRESNVKEFLETAGRFQGICDNRPEFGLFTVEKFEKLEEEE